MKKKATLDPVKSLLKKDAEEDSMQFQLMPYGLMLLRTLGQSLNRSGRRFMPVETDSVNISLITGGEADLIVNQHKLHLCSGCLLLKTPGSIIQMQDCSADYDMQILDISNEFVSDIMQGHEPPMMQPRMKEWVLSLSEDEQRIWHRMTDAVWLAIQGNYPQMVRAQVAAIIHFVHDLVLNANKDISAAHLRNVKLLNRFLQLFGRVEYQARMCDGGYVRGHNYDYDRFRGTVGMRLTY